MHSAKGLIPLLVSASLSFLPAPAGAADAAGAQRPRLSREPLSSRPLSLEQAVRSRLGRSPFRGARVGVEIVSLRDGRSLCRVGADLPLAPASTMKLLTSAAALDRLGPDWRFETRLLAAAPPVDGVIQGDLYVKGVCEPDLVLERFPEFAAGLLAAGVHEVKGDVVADLSYFDGEERPPEWPHGGALNPYAAPISALAANFSSVRVTVAPGSRLGAPAAVLVEPASDAVVVTANVRTTRAGRSVRASRILRRTPEGGLANRILVTGQIGLRAKPWEEFIPIENPALVTISAVHRALKEGGITVRGGTRLSAAPPGAMALCSVRSKPLAEIVRDMNKHSNNFIAEMLHRALGAEVYGPPASRAKGSSAVLAFLRTCGIDPEGLTLIDGSGLSRSNTLTATALVRVLVRMRGDPGIEGVFVDSLPIGGVDGTLQGRMAGTPFGRVRAKTGHVNGVAALAGYVDDASEGPLAFAFIVNGASHQRAVAALDDLCRILCTPR